MKQTHLYIVLILAFVVLTGYTNKRITSGGGLKFFSVYMENPDSDSDLATVYHFLHTAIATSVHCQCRGSTPVAILSWGNDDGSPAVVHSNISCDAEEERLVLAGDTTFDVGSNLDLNLVSTSGTITDCSFFIYFE